mgnify:CR=1 FL=1
MANKFKIRKGDNVIVTAGKDSGKTGEVLLVYTNTSRVLVRVWFCLVRELARTGSRWLGPASSATVPLPCSACGVHTYWTTSEHEAPVAKAMRIRTSGLFSSCVSNFGDICSSVYGMVMVSHLRRYGHTQYSIKMDFYVQWF